MNIVSWNINGLKSCLNKGLADFIKTDKSDIYCFQESKISEENFDQLQNCLFPVFYGYNAYNFAASTRKGYSGLVILSKNTPIKVTNGLGIKGFDEEARVQIAEYPSFFLINTYVPHPRADFSRLEYKMSFCESLLKLASELKQKKKVVLAGDFNVAHTNLDLQNPKMNKGSPMFSLIERAWVDKVIENNFFDVFRYLYPEKESYSWFPYSINNIAREKNKGWRIDYFFLDIRFKGSVQELTHLKNISGSDHVPLKIVMGEI